MRPDPAAALPVIRLADYTPPEWRIDQVSLTIDLQPTATRVVAELAVSRTASAGTPRPDLVLDGEGLTLISASLNGAPLDEGRYQLDAEKLMVAGADLPGDSFTWRCETEIDPKDNTALEGLYMSRDMFCTQCEAEGFRKITFYPDRPDVMSVFTVRIEADRVAFPVLLSNGNPIEAGPLPDGRHFATWYDPFPKPSYLFALVAGNLVSSEDTFTTASGRDVKLQIFTRHGDEDKTAYALDALKRSMTWDEEVYGREYDLDLFMIVAVDDFNMGAMENKGLNVFNSKYILASPETATDRDYELIESVVAHEYFHNWTGNRITCRDWFQLCLKEGLTVYRDQQFSEDQRSAAVMRIDGVKTLRARQFREDAGPLAHPVRPQEYSEINNFYTATVYEKGAEVVRMLHTLLGPEVYRKALDLYFERHDGEACTIEQFRKCFEDVSGRNLDQFALWWQQAGTPRLLVAEEYDAPTRRYTLTLRQETPPTPGQKEKLPVVMPLRLALFEASGTVAAPETMLALDTAEKRLVFDDLSDRPIPSINRGFSAPLIVERATPESDRIFLLEKDDDPFNKWEAGRLLVLDAILASAEAFQRQAEMPDHAALTSAMGAALTDERQDPAFRALVWTLPGEDELAGEMAAKFGTADPDAINAARRHVRAALATANKSEIEALYRQMATPGPYDPSAKQAGKRALKNACLSYLAVLDDPACTSLVDTQFRSADNMTDQMPALTALVHTSASTAGEALSQFYAQWRDDALVLGKWFGVQATSPAEDALETVRRLTDHPAFEWKNPNKFRALIGAFAMGNPINFHRADGSGYSFFTDWLLRLDPVNPQTASKLVSAFETWRRYDEPRQKLIHASLERIVAEPTLSRDAKEMVTRVLGA